MLINSIPIIPLENRRSCNECTACCEGWLEGEVQGHSFWAGRPCHFVLENGCSIYESRPETPCKKYNCFWKNNTNLPEWMKPSRSGVIITERITDGIPYLEIMEMGKKIDSTVLNYVLTEAMNNKICKNIKYQIAGGWNYIGSPDFVNMMQKINYPKL